MQLITTNIGMQVKILGHLEADLNGRTVAPTAAKPRQILALLALHAGQVVSISTLIDEVWGERVPRSANATIQSYILQLRRLISAALGGMDGAKDILVTRFNGYALEIPPDSVDAQGFERLADEGIQAFDRGDYTGAIPLLRAALDMWRGPVLADLPLGMALSVEATRLGETRLSVLETRIGAEMRVGRHRFVLSELAALTAQHPMNENLCAQYMISLYRSGRRGHALNAFQNLRTTLVNELGVEPSARLQHLQRAILESHPSLDRAGTRELQEQIA